MPTLAGPDIFCTSYCNHGHSMTTGRPVNHECIIIPPAALAAEREGDISTAIDIIASRSPRRTCKAT